MVNMKTKNQNQQTPKKGTADYNLIKAYTPLSDFYKKGLKKYE